MNKTSEKALSRFSLDGKVAVIIGGGGYLGLPISMALAEHGARLVIADVRKDAADNACRALAQEGLKAEAAAVDVADENAIAAFCGDIAARYGTIDIAINTTCYSTGKTMNEMSLADWTKGMKVSLDGAFLFAREMGKVMSAAGKGSIIQFSSMYGKVSPDPRIYGPKYNVNPVDYGAAKAAILQMVRYQAVMLGPCGVRVNSIIPGPFPNPAGQGGDADFVSKLSAKVPMGRVGRAKEIAGAVIFLASDASSFVTGTEIVIDGGWTAW